MTTPDNKHAHPETPEEPETPETPATSDPDYATRFARKLNPSVVLEPELIGGIRVVVGDEVLDTSVKARLEQMKVALTA